MNRHWFVGLAILVIACGEERRGDPEEFRRASPSRQNLAITLPEGGQALSSDSSGHASMYVLTREVSQTVNGGLFFVRALIEAIIAAEPTHFDGGTAVWGPYTAPLSPDSWRFTVTRATGGFEYVLDAKHKEDEEEDFFPVLSGRHEPRATGGGIGAFLLDWDAAQKLADPPEEVGRAQYAYEREAAGDLDVGAQFRQVKDGETGELVDFDYRYVQLVGGIGSLDFALQKDLHASGSAQERFAVRSRWMSDGAGRSDAKLSEGDLPDEVIAGQCWNSGFASVWWADSVGFEPASGDESACAFPSQSLPAL